MMQPSRELAALTHNSLTWPWAEQPAESVSGGSERQPIRLELPQATTAPPPPSHDKQLNIASIWIALPDNLS